MLRGEDYGMYGTDRLCGFSPVGSTFGGGTGFSSWILYISDFQLTLEFFLFSTLCSQAALMYICRRQIILCRIWFVIILGIVLLLCAELVAVFPFRFLLQHLALLADFYFFLMEKDTEWMENSIQNLHLSMLYSFVV